MERIPEKFILDEDDLREAITNWINDQVIDNGEAYDFTINFKVETKQSPGKGLPGGMNDPIITTVISAVAEKDE